MIGSSFGIEWCKKRADVGQWFAPLIRSRWMPITREFESTSTA